VWSVPAAMRAARATVVIPLLFAVTDKVIADPQMALFATFGGFATLVIAAFSGTRKDKLIAHAGLAVAGSLALIIGTLASGTAWVAAVVTVPVVFAIFFAGVVGPNVATGTTAALFAYVLPVASAGGVATIPSRLAGWWLASAAGTIAVLLFSPPPPGDRLRASAASLAAELADRVRAASAGQVTDPHAMRTARDKLRVAFTAAPFRPTGLATADQALASVVQFLDWAATQVGDAFDGHVDMTQTCPADRALLRAAAAVFGDVRALLAGQDASPDFGMLEAARADSATRLRDLSDREGKPDARVAAAHAVHAQAIAVAARSAAADALIASRRAAPETIAAERRVWNGVPGSKPFLPNGSSRRSPAVSRGARIAGLQSAGVVVARHATVRSVWFANSLRGALALAAAVAVADLSGVQHGFWVVLGTLSVLRTNAMGTGSTAWRALAGTVVGFVIGALLLAAIGTGQTALWVALPAAILVAAYAPGTTPFLVGQAAFTITIVVLFNILAPAGWKVGLLRIEDVAIGCAVSLVVGVLCWPRGASGIVGDDLADAFRSGAQFLTQAVDWALSELMTPPAAAAAAVAAGLRLDDALRGFLAEQGSKRASKEDLWALVTASVRLRLTANTLSGLRHAELAELAGPACLPLDGSDEYANAPACGKLRSAAEGLAGFYGQIADELARPGRNAAVPTLITPPPMPGPAVPRPVIPRPGGEPGSSGGPGADGFGVSDASGDPHAVHFHHPHLLWVQEHLRHLGQSAQMVSGPALRIAEARRRPWWR
jgi:uncharacterized membrane protein YccC